MIDLLRRFLFPTLLAMALVAIANAESVEPRSTFISEVFGGHSQHSPKTLWLDKALKQQLKDLFDYDIKALRIRYWMQDDTSVWILDEVGKEQPITMGLVINANGVKKVEVLEYRESRGGEIQYPFFTQQFNQASLYTDNNKQKLDKQIDGITGATLSVRAMVKVAKVALFLHKHVFELPSKNESGIQSQ